MSGYYKKIMIIDDDRVDRMTLKRLIVQRDFAEEIMEAETGMNALDVLTAVGMQHQQFPELIFLDVNMPAMTGFQFLDVLVNLSPAYIKRCRIVILSSVSIDEEKERSFKYDSVIGYYTKPITAEILARLKEQVRHTNAS